MNAPQIIVIAASALSIGISFAKHGEPADVTHSLPRTMLAVALNIGLLYWGGFFGGAA
jgi:hypothetical protein